MRQYEKPNRIGFVKEYTFEAVGAVPIRIVMFDDCAKIDYELKPGKVSNSLK